MPGGTQPETEDNLRLGEDVLPIKSGCIYSS